MHSCASCHSSCATCNGSAESQCITCRSGRFAHDGKCLNSCPDGFYADKKRQECIPCPTGCATCSSNGFCLTCQENWTRNKKGKCIITGSENCDECAGPLACTSCPAHFMLDGGLCMECLGSQYYDSPTQTCKTCHDSCRSCTGPGQYSCKTCAFPLHLDRLNNQCVPCCPNDASPEDQSCCHCDKDTAAEQQQFGSSYGNSGGLYGNLADDVDGKTSVGGSLGSYFSRVGSPLTTITAIAVAACLLIVTVFALIFAILQRSSNQPPRKMIRYNKIPTTAGKRRNRITSSSTLLKIDGENYVEDEEEEEDDENDDIEEGHNYEIDYESRFNIAYDEKDQHDSDIEYYNRNNKKNDTNVRKTKLKTLRKRDTPELQTVIRVPNKKILNSAIHQTEKNTQNSENNRTT
uniref:Furin-like cysteine-rich domain-containing protein n=1 Tax=Glossina palpalis gambiensis TaxID=67801 RepID=A0A1B0AQK3_9MUSC